MRWWWWMILIIALVGGGIFLNRKRVIDEMSTDQLSANFSLAEFVQTSTGLDNIPGAQQKANLKNLCVKLLQPVRDYFGWPVTITSGFRSDLVNTTVGGANDEVKGKISQHTKGEAADFSIMFIYPKQTTPTEAAALNLVIAKISAKQLGAGDIEAMHNAGNWIWKIKNEVIIKAMQKLRLPYDQVIDEQLYKTDSLGTWRLAKHVHASYSSNQTRLQYLSARNTKEGWTAQGAKSYQYTTIKVGYA